MQISISQKVLRSILISVLTEIKESKDITEHESMINDLAELLTQEQATHLQHFSEYLQENCDLSPKIVGKIVQKLLTFQKVEENIGTKLVKLWLQFEIYEAMDIHRKKDKQKRKNVRKQFIKYNFDGSNLYNLIKFCLLSINQQEYDENINDMAKEIEKKVIYTKEIFKLPSSNFANEKSQEEQLQDLIQDYKSAPNGLFLKELQREIILSFVQNTQKGRCSLQKIPQLSSAQKSIEKLREKYRAQNYHIPSEIEQLFTKIKSSDASELYEILCALKSKVFSINVFQLDRLIEKTNKAKMLIKDKDVILIIGNTGSGKSTNILRFLGYNLKPGKIGKLVTLVPTKQLKDQHKTFYTSPEAKSCTRYINAVPVPDEMYKKGLPEIKKKLMICDSPGFGDSAGVEVDIANGVGMINALFGARSLRIVVILPYDSLTADRMAGTLKISEIVSNIFYNLEVLESIAIFFNKVPKDQINAIPNLIESKLKNLTKIEKSNQKMNIFLRAIYDASCDRDNFIDPLQSNYKAIFNQLQLLPPINKIQEKLLYEFSHSTKNQIDKFLQSQKALVKQFYKNKQYQYSQFHLSILQRLKIIIHNQKAEAYYKQLVDFIEKDSKTYFNEFEQIIVEITSGKQRKDLKQKIQEARSKIIQKETYFRTRHCPNVISKQKIQQCIQHYQEDLLNEFNDPIKLTIETIKAVKIFSQNLASEVKGKAIQILSKKFKEIYKEVHSKIRQIDKQNIPSELKQKSLSQIKTSLQNLKILAQFEVLLIKADQGQSFGQMTILEKYITNQVLKKLQKLKQIKRKDFKVKDQKIKDINSSINYIKDIETICFLPNFEKYNNQLKQTLDFVEQKCKNIIRDIQNLNFSLTEEGKINIQKDQLKSKKTQIELLINIKDLQKRVLEDYEYAKQSIARQLKENVQILKICLDALKTNKEDQIYRNIENIRKAISVVIQCSKIVDDSEKNLEIAQSIGNQFIKYLNSQSTGLKAIDVKLSQLNEEKLRKIKHLYNKLDSYEKMCGINDQVKKAVEKLNNQLNEKLKAPFIEYSQKGLIYVSKQKSYKLLPKMMDKLQKFSLYALGIEDTVSSDLYKTISQPSQSQIIQCFEAIFNQMEKQIKQFLNHSHKNGHPKNLKELIKVLQLINSKFKSCQYISRKINFEIAQKINFIHAKLHDLKENMEDNLKQNISNFKQIENIIYDCKFYTDIQSAFNYKENYAKIGFKELLESCQNEFCKSLKTDEQQINAKINQDKASQISFVDLKPYYEKFATIKSAESIAKRRLIVQKLRKVQKKVQQQLKSLKNVIEDSTLSNFSSQDLITNFLESFSQAVYLQKNLKDLYTEQEDKQKILIKHSQIRKIGKKIVTVFKNQCILIIDLLNNLNLANLGERLKKLNSIQSIIYQVFKLDDYDDNKETKGDIQKRYIQEDQELLKFRDQYILQLRQKIQKHEFIKQDKVYAKSNKRLKTLLQFLKKGIEEEIKIKYENVGQHFVVDSNFQKYYSYSDKKIRKKLEENVESFFSKKCKQYKMQYTNKSQISDKVQQQIEGIISHLPYEIKQEYKSKFDSITNSLKKEFDEKLKQISNNILENSDKIKQYLQKCYQQLKNGHTSFHQSLVKKFDENYLKHEQKMRHLSSTDKMAFLQNFIINLFSDYHTYFDNDTKMLQKLKKHYRIWTKQIQKNGQQAIQNLLKVINQPMSDQSFKTINLNVSLIFEIINFSNNIKITMIEDEPEYRRQIKDSFEKKIDQIVQQYKEILNTRPKQKLNSEHITKSGTLKRINNFSEQLTLAGQIIKQMKEELDKSQNYYRRSVIHPKEFLKSIQDIEDYENVLKIYKQQAKEMYNFAWKFEFYGDIKRNMTDKELSQELNRLNITLQILASLQPFLMKFIFSKQQKEFDLKKLSQRIQNNFQGNQTQLKKQIESVFDKIFGSHPSKINLFIKQLSIMKKKDMDYQFISSDEINKIQQSINNQIDQKFEKAKENCQENVSKTISTYGAVSKKVTQLRSQLKRKIQQTKEQASQTLEKEILFIQSEIDQSIKNQEDQNKKNNLRNKKSSQTRDLKNNLKRKNQEDIRKLEEEYQHLIQDQFNNTSTQIQNLVISLIILHRGLIDISEGTEKYKIYLENILSQLKKNPLLLKEIQKVLLNCPNDNRKFGMNILITYSNFWNFKTSIINKIIKGYDIEYVINNLKSLTLQGKAKLPQKQYDTIKMSYKIFKEKYDLYLESYKECPNESTINSLFKLKYSGDIIKEQFYRQKSPNNLLKQKVQLLAGIFALWAIIKAITFEGEVQYTIEPHPTQITTLILLLGISHPDEKTANRLAQVGTGQGKSIVLAGLCCYLALVGFKVRCACYSSYLSSRDQGSFKQLFQRLDVDTSIKYGTFNQICEDILNNDGKNLKDQVEKMLLQPPNGVIQHIANFFGKNIISVTRQQNQIQKNPTILIIDEVDVFFQDHFFGNCYCPGINLKGNQVTEFLKYVWKQFNQNRENFNKRQLIKSSQFKKLTERYQSLKDLLQNQVDGMISGAFNFKHDYLVIKKSIIYKDNDEICQNINYGYKTVFANLHEYDHKRVSESSVNAAMNISLMIAQFSYAALPKYFYNILGVTGTLEALPFEKKKQLYSRYDIKENYLIPSPFGSKKQRKQEYTVASKEYHYKQITESIRQTSSNRPIIVYFSELVQLNDFMNSPEFKPFAERASRLTEEHNQTQRDNRIKNAVNPGIITLMSSAFGRGTDFMIFDEATKQAGGLHIIQAFLSLDEAQEVQIKGRTARQNSPGSYHCIINQACLQQLSLSRIQLPKETKSSQIHKILAKARQKRMTTLSQTINKKLQDAEKRHNNVVQIFTKPKLAQKDLIQYVFTLNRYPQTNNTVIKTVIGLDATGSMSNALNKTIEIIGKTFDQSYEVLKKANVGALIEVMIMVYRNYNSPSSEIIESTSFENTAVKLKNFLEGVKAKGGSGNEALEVLFQQLNDQKRIDQVILIGDAPPNTQNEVLSKRSFRGEEYWNRNEFPLTHINQELQRFKQKKCPVHSFYLNNGEGFTDISKKTGGYSSKFDINSRNVVQNLTRFVVENTLRTIQNTDKSIPKLVDTYRRLFVEKRQ